MIYIICYKTDYLSYILEGISEVDYEIIELKDYSTKLQRIISRKFPFFIPYSILYFNKKMKSKFQKMNFDDSLLVIDYAEPHLLKILSNILPKNFNKNLWLWNPLKNKKKKIIDIIKKNGFNIYTFNKLDADDNQLKFLKQFYRFDHQYLNENNTIFDCYFLGFEKGRKKELSDLSEKLFQYKNHFIVINKIENVISYKENLEHVKKSSCIIEIVQKNQIGLSLRPFEAIAFRKKLLTNNIEILQEDFYSPENIFVIGYDQWENFEKFLTSPFKEIDNSILNKYDVNSWIKNFKST